jgi:hypothetical protein
LQEVGYNHGKTYFAGLLKAGLLPIFKPEQGKANHPHESSCYTFTDLAQMVCKVAHNQYMDESGECRGTGYSLDTSNEVIINTFLIAQEKYSCVKF